MLNNLALSGTSSGRMAVFHLPTLVDLKHAVFTFLSWLAPRAVVEAAWPLLLAGLGLGALLVAVELGRTRRTWLPRLTQRRRAFQSPGAFPLALAALLLAFIPIYILAILASMTFLDAFIPLDSRVLSPVYVTGVIAAIGLIGRWLARSEQTGVHRWPQVAASSLLALLVISYGFQGMAWVGRNHASGEDLGVAGASWRQSPLIAMLKSSAAGHPAGDEPDRGAVPGDRACHLWPAHPG